MCQGAGYGLEGEDCSGAAQWRRSGQSKQLEEQLSYTDIISPIDGSCFLAMCKLGDA